MLCPDPGTTYVVQMDIGNCTPWPTPHTSVLSVVGGGQTYEELNTEGPECRGRRRLR